MFDHYHTGVASASTLMCLQCFCQLCEIRRYEVRVTVPGYVQMKWVRSKLKRRAHGDLTGQPASCQFGGGSRLQE